VLFIWNVGCASSLHASGASAASPRRMPLFPPCLETVCFCDSACASSHALPHASAFPDHLRVRTTSVGHQFPPCLARWLASATLRASLRCSCYRVMFVVVVSVTPFQVRRWPLCAWVVPRFNIATSGLHLWCRRAGGPRGVGPSVRRKYGRGHHNTAAHQDRISGRDPCSGALLQRLTWHWLAVRTNPPWVGVTPHAMCLVQPTG
jgi:hypothetical protein